jgi:hypothetical protein
MHNPTKHPAIDTVLMLYEVRVFFPAVNSNETQNIWHQDLETLWLSGLHL